MISKTYTERTSENSLYHKRNEKIYIQKRNQLLLELWKFTKIIQESEQSSFKNKQESRVSVRISFMDFNLTYHFSLPLQLHSGFENEQPKGATIELELLKLHSQRIVSINLSGGSLEDPTYKAGCCFVFAFVLNQTWNLPSMKRLFPGDIYPKTEMKIGGNELCSCLRQPIQKKLKNLGIKMYKEVLVNFRAISWECRCSDIQL